MAGAAYVGNVGDKKQLRWRKGFGDTEWHLKALSLSMMDAVATLKDLAAQGA
jgi:hypothetical protein